MNSRLWVGLEIMGIYYPLLHGPNGLDSVRTGIHSLGFECALASERCSLQTPGLPAANPAYPLTCSNPCVGFKFFTFQNNKP